VVGDFGWPKFEGELVIVFFSSQLLAASVLRRKNFQTH
jgi:hypothetical protein